MNIVCISDTHNSQINLDIPYCDLLIHAGDITVFGTEPEFNNFLNWFIIQPAKHKVFIAGNHDLCIHKNRRKLIDDNFLKENDIHYLENSSVDIDGFKIFGSPMSVTYGNWAFMRDDEDLYDYWNNIPNDVDILITHTPQKGVLDSNQYNINCGSNSLKNKMKDLYKLRLHVFGHIHESKGTQVTSSKNNRFLSVNASVSDGYDYKKVYPTEIKL